MYSLGNETSEQSRQTSSGVIVAAIMAQVAKLFYILYLIIVVADCMPLALLDNLWQLKFASTLVNAMTIPFAGLVFVHLAAALSPLDNKIANQLSFQVKLARLAAAGFLLLLPIIGFSNWKGVSNVRNANYELSMRAQSNAARLNAELESATSPQDLQTRMRKLQGPIIPNSELAKPLPELKQQTRAIIGTVVNNYIAGLPTPKATGYQEIYRQSIRTSLMAVIGSFASAALAYDPVKQISLLQELVRLPSFFLRLARSLRGGEYPESQAIFRPFSDFLNRSFFDRRNQESKRFWARFKENEKRANARWAKEVKRNAVNLRRLQHERERKRLKEERQRAREERRNRHRRDDQAD